VALHVIESPVETGINGMNSGARVSLKRTVGTANSLARRRRQTLSRALDHLSGRPVGSGSWGGRRPSLADYVAGTGATRGRAVPEGVHIDYPPQNFRFANSACLVIGGDMASINIGGLGIDKSHVRDFLVGIVETVTVYPEQAEMNLVTLGTTPERIRFILYSDEDRPGTLTPRDGMWRGAILGVAQRALTHQHHVSVTAERQLNHVWVASSITIRKNGN
jgi:hypothetical protein